MSREFDPSLAQEKSAFRLSDHLNMTIAVDWDVKAQVKQTIKVIWRENMLIEIYKTLSLIGLDSR